MISAGKERQGNERRVDARVVEAVVEGGAEGVNEAEGDVIEVEGVEDAAE